MVVHVVGALIIRPGQAQIRPAVVVTALSSTLTEVFFAQSVTAHA